MMKSGGSGKQVVKYNRLLVLERVRDKVPVALWSGDLVSGGPLLSPMTDAGWAGGLG